MGRWSKQGCIHSAREYSYLKTWIRERKTAYLAARDNGWLNECCAHMSRYKRRKWTLEECLASACNYGSSKDWRVGEKEAYDAATINGWLERCTEHMVALKHHESNKESSAGPKLRLKTQIERSKNYGDVSEATKRKTSFEEYKSHIIENAGSVSKANCVSASKPYTSIDDFYKYEHFYFKIAKENGWLPSIKDIYYESNTKSWIETNLVSIN